MQFGFGLGPTSLIQAGTTEVKDVDVLLPSRYLSLSALMLGRPVGCLWVELNVCEREIRMYVTHQLFKCPLFPDIWSVCVCVCAGSCRLMLNTDEGDEAHMMPANVDTEVTGCQRYFCFEGLCYSPSASWLHLSLWMDVCPLLCVDTISFAVMKSEKLEWFDD